MKIRKIESGIICCKLALLSIVFFISPPHFAKADSLSYQDLVKSGLPAVEKHLEQYTDINLQDNFGDTLLVQAAINNSLAIVRFLITKGADTNLASQSKHKSGYTPLMAAVESGSQGIIKLLLDKEVQINATTSKTAWRPGYTALMHASLLGKTKIAGLLIEHGATLDHQSAYGQNSLMLAAAKGHTEMIKLLIDSGIDINAVSQRYINKGNAALHYATQAKNNRYKTIKQLLSAGVDIKMTNEKGRNALHLAAYKDAGVIKQLLDADMSTSVTDVNGYTPLMIAAERNKIEVVRLLLKSNASVNARNRFGSTAYDISVNKGHLEITELLKQHLNDN